MVEIKELYKSYGLGEDRIIALEGVNLTIEKGDIYGIIGLSGAGKSSLVRCVNLLEKPDRGEITINGRNILELDKKSLRQARKRIGMIFQHFNLLMNSTVYDNIAFPLKLEKRDKNKIKERVEETLRLVGLEDKKNSYPSALSGGQKQRVGIARAIAADPDIIMCDEATSALDPETTKSILQLLKKINKELGMTIIIITHEMDVIKEICSKVAVLDKGKIVEKGLVSDIYVNPGTETATRFFKAYETDINTEILKDVISKGGTIIKALFTGEKSVDPYISNMVKRFDVEAAILLGGIEKIGGSLIGNLVINIKGEPGNIKAALNYLAENNVKAEVLNDD